MIRRLVLLALGLAVGVVAVATGQSRYGYGYWEYLILQERVAPDAVADHASLYAKDKAGVSALYFKRDDGSEVDLTVVGGGAAWGTITGTLSTQADLQAALDAKEAAGAFSGIGACAANQWASTLNDGAAPTCAQPGFSNLSGAATDAQVPNTVTIDLAAAATALAADPADCADAAHFAVGVAALGTATCEAITDADVPNTITVDLATLATTATTANAGDSATAFFSAGTIEVARGGTGAAPGADDEVLVADSAAAATWKALPDCDGDTTVLHYDTATNAFSCGDDDTGGGAGNTSYVRLAADSALSTTTKTNLTGMAFTLLANTSYSWQCHMFTTANAATVGVQFAVTFAGTVTAVRGLFQGPGAATTLLWIADTTFQLDYNPTASQGNVAGMVTLSGTVEVSGTGGTLQFLHSSETATLTTVQRGSWCQLATHS